MLELSRCDRCGCEYPSVDEIDVLREWVLPTGVLMLVMPGVFCSEGCVREESELSYPLTHTIAGLN